MLLESLFNGLGERGVLLLGLVGLALPLALVGVVLRRLALGARRRWDPVAAARRPLRDLGRGRVTVAGVWHNLGAGRGLLEDEGARALVMLSEGVTIADGQRVLVSGFALRQEDDPRGDAYRASSRVWVIEGAGDPVLVADEADPVRTLRRARIGLHTGAGLLALSVAVAVATGALCWRATHEGWEVDSDLTQNDAPPLR